MKAKLNIKDDSELRNYIKDIVREVVQENIDDREKTRLENKMKDLELLQDIESKMYAGMRNFQFM